PEHRRLNFAPTVRILAAGCITPTPALVPAEPLGGTSFEPTSLVTNRRFCACEAGTNRHDVPIKPRSSEAHLIAVARRKQFMSRPPDGAMEAEALQRGAARTPHKPA